MARSPPAGARRAIRQRLHRASHQLALARCGGHRRTHRRAGAAPAPTRAARRAAAEDRDHGRLRRALGLPAARQYRSKVRRLRRGHRDQGHALPLGAAALDLLEHRLESDSRMCCRTLARQTAAAGPTAMLRRSRGPSARARQACGSRPADTIDCQRAQHGTRRRSARLPRIRRIGRHCPLDGLA